MPSIKDILKKVGLVSAAVAPIFIPAAGPAIAAVEAIAKHEGDPGQNIADAFQGWIKVLESVKDEDIANEDKIHAAILLANQAQQLFLEGLKNQ